ncbi:MAG: glycosyltransferase involved in cell wall biosynthesis [Alteromonadaceae bacterium]|jgi:glycosyltransferase involved in cell wall biosynthesis
MSNLPKVSVWIPTYNRKSMLERALNSVLKQTYDNLEIFIVDNGSTDGTEKMIEGYIDRFSNIKYHRFDSNKGACEARNFAIINGTGELMTGLDDDDEFLPNRIHQLVDAYDEKYSFICTGFYWDYGTYSKARIDSFLEIKLHDQLNFNQASNQVLVSKKKLIEVGGFDRDMVSCQDWDLWTRLIIKFGMAVRINKASYVVHTGHNKPRITSSIVNRLTGIDQFYCKYSKLMSKQNGKCFAFLRLYNSEEKLSVIDFFRLFTWPIKDQLVRYFIASRFPKLAKKRLQRLGSKEGK